MPRIIKPHEKPEHKIQKALIEYLGVRGWLVEVMHGNAFQKGIPDLYLFHPRLGPRWVDVKRPGKYSFTKAQRLKWPLWDHYGVGIWILTAANQEEYDKLMAPPNWRDYWKASWALPTLPEIDRMLDDLDAEEYDDAWDDY
jgi:hypothetical protein